LGGPLPVTDHQRWVGDIEDTQGYAVNYPLIGDADLNVAKLYGMIEKGGEWTLPSTRRKRTA